MQLNVSGTYLGNIADDTCITVDENPFFMEFVSFVKFLTDFCGILQSINIWFFTENQYIEGYLDLILAGLGREGHLVKVIEVRVEQRLPRRDTLRRVIDQHLNIDTLRRVIDQHLNIDTLRRDIDQH